MSSGKHIKHIIPKLVLTFCNIQPCTIIIFFAFLLLETQCFVQFYLIRLLLKANYLIRNYLGSEPSVLSDLIPYDIDRMIQL